MVRIKMRVPVLAGTAMIALAGAVLATAQLAQAQGMQAPAAQTAPTSGVQLAGLKLLAESLHGTRARSFVLGLGRRGGGQRHQQRAGRKWSKEHGILPAEAGGRPDAWPAMRRA